MENLLNYVNLRKDIDFSMRPFNKVDMLMCADLSYVDFDGIVNEEEISLEEACKQYFSLHSEEEIQSKYAFSMNIPNLVKSLQDTSRYKGVKLKNYKNIYSDEKILQFRAITIVLPDGTLVVSFSGTDGSITGWKENLMMTYKNDLPCQILAKEYVKDGIESIPETTSWFGFKKKKIYPKIYITGHSKGGNLAIYSYLENESIKEHITKVYAFDAPGFMDDFWMRHSELDKIENYVPKASIIGQVLEHREYQWIMDANENGLAGHDTFTWSVNTNDFNYLETLSGNSDEILEYIDKLLLSKSIEEKERYCYLIGEMFDRMDIHTISDLSDFSFRQALSGLKEIRQLNAEEIKFMLEIVKFIAQQSAPILMKGRK